MAKLNYEACMTIKTLVSKGVANREVARLLDVSEGAVRYQIRQMTSGAEDSRCLRASLALDYAEAISHWREAIGDGPVNLVCLHEWLVTEHDYLLVYK